MLNRRLIRLLITALLVALPVTAPAGEDPTMLPPDAHADWQAIGRLNHSGYKQRKLCSATLIAPDLVLTAAHCVTHDNGQPMPLADFRFVAGWFRGEYAAVGHVAGLTVPKRWLFAAAQGRIDSGADLALVHLRDAITTVTPLPVRRPDRGRVRILGYRWDRPHALSDSGSCLHRQAEQDVRATDCQATFGTSGAPVLQQQRDGWVVVGTVSSIGSGLTYFAAWQRLDAASSRSWRAD